MRNISVILVFATNVPSKSFGPCKGIFLSFFFTRLTLNVTDKGYNPMMMMMMAPLLFFPSFDFYLSGLEDSLRKMYFVSLSG